MATRGAVVRLLREVARHSSGCPCHGCASGLGAAASGRGLANLRGVQAATAEGSGPTPSREYAFEMASSNIRYGPGVTREVGMDLRNLGASSVCVVTDPHMRGLRPVQTAVDSLEAAGVRHSVFDDVSVEPTDVSFQRAIAFARASGFDAFVAVGGGSVMDTAKAMNLYSAVPEASFLDFVNAPVGLGKPVPATAPIKPLIAVPTTAGTGSETTGVAIFDHTPLRAKTGIGNRLLRPTLGLVDPHNTATMPSPIAASSGFDVLCHALEAFTALPFHDRTPRPEDPKFRPAYQVGAQTTILDSATPLELRYPSLAVARCFTNSLNREQHRLARETLRLMASHFVPAVTRDDPVAKENMALAATYAGIGFGNAGVHLCHGLSYPISGLNKGYIHPGYEHASTKLVPHGISVVVTAPAVFRFTGPACPERHLEAAQLLGADVSNAKSTGSYAGNLLAERVQWFMDAMGVPPSLKHLGFTSSDIPALVAGTMPQQRVTQLSPHGTPDEEALAAILEDAL